MKVLKRMTLPSPKRDVAARPIKTAPCNVQRARAFKPVFVVVGRTPPQLTPVTLAVPPLEMGGVSQTAGATASVQIGAAETLAIPVLAKVSSDGGPDDSTAQLTLVAKELGSAAVPVVAAQSGLEARPCLAERLQIESLAAERATEPAATAAEVSIDGCPESPVYVIADLVAEVMRLRLTVESALAALEQSCRPRSAGRRASIPTGPVLLEGLAGKKLMDIRAVESLVGAKRSTIYGWIKAGKFVQPVRLSAKASRWVADEVVAWLDARGAERGQA